MTAPCPWAMQREAAARLGISERTLHRWRSADLLQAGVHYRRKFSNPNSPLLYYLERCEQAMNEAAARHPGRLEVAPLSSSQSRSQPMEVAPTAGPGSLRGVCFPPAPHRPPQGQPRDDAQPLTHGRIHPVAGPIAEHLRGIQGHRPRARLRRGRLVC
jgi:hypothetical protein